MKCDTKLLKKSEVVLRDAPLPFWWSHLILTTNVVSQIKNISAVEHEQKSHRKQIC